MGVASNFTARYFLIAPFKLRKKLLGDGKEGGIETFPQGVGQIGPFLGGNRKRQFLDLRGTHLKKS